MQEKFLKNEQFITVMEVLEKETISRLKLSYFHQVSLVILQTKTHS